ncbi:lipopolysaccharide transport periplasmic protein LptA [Legionella sp. CNM-4043-24]|uniref:lipopolysaccharide transport periplasmic protein LptA n=1 Tax=Legionella sp. CNM-4043-24 TaxID=3421646 RepID=UPI00403AA630
MRDDCSKSARLAADSADLNQLTHRGVYLGNVQFDQGTTHLRASKAITEGNAQNKLTFAAAYGSQTEQAHYWEKTAENKPLLHAWANEIRYYPERHLIELIGNARIVQGNDSFSAAEIRYDTEKQHVVANSKGKTRTMIIFHPEKAS